MSVIFIALPIAILLGASAMVACVLCIRSGQYDDMDTPAVRMLIDDQPQAQKTPKAAPPLPSPSEPAATNTARGKRADLH